MLLSDAALTRILTCDPALPEEAAPALIEALGKLFVQFQREGRCGASAVSIEASGRAIVIAWEGPPLSGCSHDKISQVLSAHESRTGCALLAAPPLLVAVAGQPRALLRGELRRLAAAGDIGPEAATWDVRATTLGGWRMAAGMPLNQSALAQLLTPPPAA